MYPQAQGFQSDTFQNAPNESMAFTMYSSTFGNGSFQIAPPSVGEVGDGYPSVPYLSLEALMYSQMSSNPLSSPYTTMSGSNTGQQVIGGQITQQDNTGTSRYQQGFQSTTG